MQNNLFEYVLGRAKRTLLLPFYKYIYKLKKSTNIKLLFSRALFHISSSFRSLLTLRPQKSTDYFYIGRLGIYKKLVLIAVLIICLVPVIYFEFFTTPVSVPQEIVPQAEFVYSDPDLEAFSGNAKILSAGKKLVYDGAVEKGICTGSGKLYNLDGSLLYSGDFKNNQYEGAGKLFYPSGQIMYEGAFTANQYNGTGKLFYPSGKTMYEGAFASNQYNGEGILYNTNNTVLYAGSFINGMKHGAGKLYDSTGLTLIYEGKFFEDNYSEEGTLFDTTTTRPVYQGQFKNGLFDGTGTLFSSAGRNKFTGQFLKGLPDYVYFLDLPSAELSRHFFSSPAVASSGTSTYLTYSDMKVSFVLDEAALEELSPPSIDSIVVYDGTLPSGIKSFSSLSDCKSILGDPLYEGYSYLLPEDLIALEYLAKQNILAEDTELYSAVSNISFKPSDTPDSFVMETDSQAEIYLACYEYQGFSLTLFFEKEDGKFLYYRWDMD